MFCKNCEKQQKEAGDGRFHNRGFGHGYGRGYGRYWGPGYNGYGPRWGYDGYYRSRIGTDIALGTLGAVAMSNALRPDPVVVTTPAVSVGSYPVYDAYGNVIYYRDGGRAQAKSAKQPKSKTKTKQK